MTTPPLDLPALREAAEEVAQHEPDFLDIHDYLSALADMQQLLSGRTVLALLDRAEAAEAKVARVRQIVDNDGIEVDTRDYGAMLAVNADDISVALEDPALDGAP